MGKLILLIEDDEQGQEVLSNYLAFTGARVIAAMDGREGARLAVEESPDLVLLDIRLPGLDGWQVMERLRLNPQTSGIPVVAVTGLDLPARDIEAAGFCGYLRKPVTPYGMLQEVERCIGSVAAPEPEERIGPLSRRYRDSRREDSTG